MRGARTKAFRLEAVKDASGQVPGAADDSAPKIYKFKASDGDWDHYQDRLSIQGWKLETFNANPIILHNHDAGDGGWLGLSRKDVLPIGRGRVYVEGDALMVDIEFDQDDEFARRVEGKVAKGMLNAVSVRYLMKKYRENERGGYDSDEQELLEISVVTIPGNARATRVRGAALEADELALIDAVADRVTEKILSKQAAAAPFDADAFKAAFDAQFEKSLKENT